MNCVKKLLALVLCVAMVSCIAPQGIFAFSDVEENPYVKSLAEKGIVKGYSDASFGPEDPCTRGQFLTFLWRATGEPAAEKNAKIKDIKGNEYYADAVWWAYENGITKIYSDDTFRADTPVDRQHAAYYLYKWAKLYNKSDMTKTMSMNKYLEDGVNISADSRTAFAWAMASGLLEAVDGGLVKPADPVTRIWTVNSIGKLLETHVCAWSDWKDNGDGTHTRVCTSDAPHEETKAHSMNDGELTVAPTETEEGLVTYTCTECKLEKKEEAPAGTEFTTRADLEEAIAYTSFAYYAKQEKAQYDSTHLTDLSAYLGGLIRLTARSAPEFATSDNTFYSVCSDYTHQIVYEALGIKDMGPSTWPIGISTTYMFRYADNQVHEQLVSNSLIEPKTEEDKNICIYRFIDFDAYKEYKKTSADSTISMFMSSGVFDTPSFTHFADGLYFKDDGYEGEVHYSYYDEAGNRLTLNEVKKNYWEPYAIQEKKYFRPGDVLVSNTHAMMYVGNDRVVDAAGYKINTTTGVDQIELGGEDPGVFNAYIPYWYLVQRNEYSSLVCARPLDLIISPCFDDDPGNDIVKDLKVPEKTLSRIKYPAMDIDRTVDITHYGTAVNGQELTYTVKISNKTNVPNYLMWAGEDGAVDYENLAVTEKIPEGCEYVKDSASEGGTYKNGVIKWDIEKIAPGECATLSYRVKVNKRYGDVIVSDGGMVDNIPSNVIKNTVGAKKLTDEEKTALSKISEAGKDGLSAFGSDTDFANAVYKSIGSELDLPSLGEITKGLFPITSHIPGYGEISRVPNFTPINLYARQDVVSKEYKELKDMVVDTFWGGRKFYVGDSMKWDFATNCIKEFKKGYLEAGDIIVYGATNDKTNLSYDFDTVGVMIYDGKNLLVSEKTADGTTYEIIDESVIETELLKLFTKSKDLFFALRPSEVK